jgi:hypothetical protein
MLSRAAIAAVGLATLVPLPVSPEEPTARGAVHPRAEVLVLGVYHMSNPGRDVFNVEADDVLAPKRQAEIAHVVAVLERFRPTKIAVELAFHDQRVATRYSDYLAGRYELTRDETEQLGFRLAKQLGHETVYPVDVDGEFPFPRLVKYTQATGRSTELEALQEETGRRVEAQNRYLASHTVLETLLEINADDRVAEALGSYFQLAEFGEPWDWAGADLVSDWFRRNLRIYSNVVRLIDSSDERVLVIYGAGHLGWLRDAFEGNPRLRLRRLADLTR